MVITYLSFLLVSCLSQVQASADALVGSFALGASAFNIVHALSSQRSNKISEFSFVDPDCVERKSWFVATGLLSGMLKSIAYDAINKRLLQPLGDRFSFLKSGVDLFNHQGIKELIFVYLLSRFQKSFVSHSLDEMGYRPYIIKPREFNNTSNSSRYMSGLKKLLENVQRSLMVNEYYQFVFQDAQQDYIIGSTAGFHLTQALTK